MLLLFDGYCGVCTRMARWAREQSDNRIAVLPYQQPGLIERYGLTWEQAEREVWLIGDGKTWSGGEAIARTLEEVGGPWKGAAMLYRISPLRPFAELAYHAFASKRHWFARWGETPACEDPDCGCLPP